MKISDVYVRKASAEGGKITFHLETYNVQSPKIYEPEPSFECKLTLRISDIYASELLEKMRTGKSIEVEL